MSETIALHYKGCQLVAGESEGGPVAYVHQGGQELARFEGVSVIDCANQAIVRIDQLCRSMLRSAASEASAV